MQEFIKYPGIYSTGSKQIIKLYLFEMQNQNVVYKNNGGITIVFYHCFSLWQRLFSRGTLDLSLGVFANQCSNNGPNKHSAQTII